MVHATLQNVAKHSLLYGYVLSQPFSTYVDAMPLFDDKSMEEFEQLPFGKHEEMVRVLAQKSSNINVLAEQPSWDYDKIDKNEWYNANDREHPKEEINDRITIDQLVEFSNVKFLEQVENLSDSIQFGMHNDNVGIVQVALKQLGYYEGEIDGIYGPLTNNALQRAELEHGIELINDLSVTPQVNDEQTESSTHVATVEVKEDTVPIVEEVQKEKEHTPPPAKVDTSGESGTIIQVANAHIGTPYVWGGTSPSGFDCSGFIQYVFSQENMTIPRTVSEMWNFSTPVNQPSIGDLVFFETYKAGPSHAGIYVGDNKFIHAGESRGVEISNLDQDYWKQRYIGAGRMK